MKYGNTMSTRPQTNGTTAFCFLPYMKKPRPMEPKSSPQETMHSRPPHVSVADPGQQ